MSKITYNPVIRSSYQQLFDSCTINPKKYTAVDGALNKITAGRTTYEAVGNRLNIPWFFIGIVHYMEGNCNFKTHLHNGDPLTARTKQVPSGRPKTGQPPFTWEYSAEDALRFKGLNKWPDWDIPGILYKMEEYNGFGYRALKKPINSPYLWSMSNHYQTGKYVADGKYDPLAVSTQCGAGVIVRRMYEKSMLDPESIDRIILLRELGKQVIYAPATYSVRALSLQNYLNSLGAVLKVDGKAGAYTSNAYKQLTGDYLSGDPRKV